MKRENHLFLFLSTPVLCVALGLLLTVSHRGMPMDPRPSRLAPLTAAEEEAEIPEPEVLLLAEEDSSLLATVEDTLDLMRTGWIRQDGFDGTVPASVRTVLLCSPSLDDLEGEGAVALMNWVADVWSVPSVSPGSGAQ